MTIPTAQFTASRVVVDIALLLQPKETEESRVFKQFLAASDATLAPGTWGCGNSLEGALLADDESAHVYVALMLPEFERFVSTDPEVAACVLPPHSLLWAAYRLGLQQGVK